MDMEQPSRTLLRLELETHAYHRDADQAWLALLLHDVTRTQYAGQLARAYRFEAPLESAIAYTPHVTSLVGTRARSRLLAHDLFALDYPAARLTPRLIAPFPSVSEALGWLYVLERGVRLYDMVRRNIRRRLPHVPTEYLADEAAKSRWNELGRGLDAIARTDSVVDQVVHAAHDAFRCALDWYVADPVRLPA
jgi:heme oxygenase